MPRKKPFSVKQKKKQLQEKRQRKQEQGAQLQCFEDDNHSDLQMLQDSISAKSDLQIVTGAAVSSGIAMRKLIDKPVSTLERKQDPHRYRLQFFKETDEEIQKRKAQARKPHEILPEKSLEVDIDQVYQPGTVLDIPRRPSWDRSMSKVKLELGEEKYFQDYLEKIFIAYKPSELSYFEMNVETWRQLWRVIEMSDVLLLVTDIRYPALNISPALYHHVTNDFGKPMILILNKVDLSPAGLVTAWKYYLQQKFPELHIICFTSYAHKSIGETADAFQGLHRRKKKGPRPRAVGPKELYEACESIVKDEVDLKSWKAKLEDATADLDMDTDSDQEEETDVMDNIPDNSFVVHEKFRDGVLTIGCVGYPNVGKSSVINGLVGKKVVSVSKTPGHTKHFQTIFLTKTVKLCDCPGLVFPSLVQKPLQILAGIYPIAHVRDPYSAVGFLAQRINIPDILKLQHTSRSPGKTKEGQWSAYEICNAWAVKCGFNTAKGGRPDVYRAANYILRLAVEGRLRLCFAPPDYTENKEFWKEHPEAQNLISIQNQSQPQKKDSSESELSESSEEEEEISVDETVRGNGEKHRGCIAVSNPFALLADD